MTQAPAVSVVIPYRDVTDFLPEALASVASQTFQDLEVLLIDDGSARPWSGEAPLPLRHLRQQPRGVSSARNHAVREARGRYVAFLDADDAWRPGKLAAQLAALEATPGAAFAYGNADFVDEAGRLKGKDFRLHFGLDPLPSGELKDVIFVKSFVLPSTMMILRERFLALGGYDESLAMGEDWELALRASRLGPVVALQEPLVLYRRHARGATLTTRGGREQLDAIVERWLAERDAGERERWRAHHRARFLVEDASVAVDRGAPLAAARDLLRALMAQPGTALREMRTRLACLVAQRRHAAARK